MEPADFPVDKILTDWRRNSQSMVGVKIQMKTTLATTALSAVTPLCTSR